MVPAAPAGAAGAPGAVPAPDQRVAPKALPSPDLIDLPETLRYRLKNWLLGPPLVTEKLASERLGRITALGVLSPDCISSSAYGTQEMLTILVPAVGIAAFSLVIPVTVAVLIVLFFVTLSYREVIQAYTKAGGSYVVARDNFGHNVAQVAAVALLIDYTVTVAVQTAAGTDALTSAFPALVPYTVPITVGVVLLMLYGNLRGIREAGRWFAIPTYFFILSLGALVVTGLVRGLLGELHTPALHHAAGMVSFGHPGEGLLLGASLFVMLQSFANGGSSLTGLEAISNGVSAFRRPEARNARQVLVAMSLILGFLVLGVSLLARWSHAVPYLSGSPMVVAQEAHFVFGHGPIGNLLFYVVEAATMLVLYTGGNTSFNGFPFLASFVAGDSFLPRQLTRRGHRLTFSNGIIVLGILGTLLVIATGANLDALIGLYAIGVFTGFTMAGAGMVRHHLREREPAWQRRLVVNGFAAVLSGAVVIIFAVTKFRQGAWVVLVLFPVLVWLLIRMHRQYASEAAELEQGASMAFEAPILRHHVVVVLVDRLDLATARAVQYARTLMPDELRAVHFAIDPRDASLLEEEWGRLGLSRLPLDIIDCPDRRLARAALELAAGVVEDGQTELTVLLPRRGYAAGWRRLLHDRSADRIAIAVGELPHVNATIVPFKLGPDRLEEELARALAAETTGAASQGQRAHPGEDLGPKASGTSPIGQATWRSRVRVAGRVRAIRVPTRASTANLECTLVDGTGAILLVFQGRRRIPGIQQGARLVAEGMVGSWEGRLAILNPDYELIAGPDTEQVETDA